jgi:hypothetical protein
MVHVLPSVPRSTAVVFIAILLVLVEASLALHSRRDGDRVFVWMVMLILGAVGMVIEERWFPSRLYAPEKFPKWIEVFSAFFVILTLVLFCCPLFSIYLVEIYGTFDDNSIVLWFANSAIYSLTLGVCPSLVYTSWVILHSSFRVKPKDLNE